MMAGRAGLAGIVGFLLLAASAPSGVAAGSAVPMAGDWEGSGPHGLPLSFALERHGGRLVATSLAVGYPARCPAVKRDAEAVPFQDPTYAGPGAGAVTVALSGRVPKPAQRVILQGSFATPGTGALSVRIKKKIGCGWPASTLSWTVHRAHRMRIGDGTWTGPLTAPGLINGNVRLVVSAQGRVIGSFTSFFTCLTYDQQGNTLLRAVPAYEFVRPGGTFYSPLDGARVKGHQASWWGQFTSSGAATGAVRIFDDCTNQMIQARFSVTRTKPA